MRDHEQVTQSLTAIGDKGRVEIIFQLASHERLNVTEIAQQFRLSRPTISHHLKVLKDAKLVGREQVGQEVYYWLDRLHVVQLLRSLADEVDTCKPERRE